MPYPPQGVKGTGGTGTNFDYTSPNNPTTDVNPSKDYATWLNTSSGEVFVCIDRTPNQNRWKGQLGTDIGLVFDIFGDGSCVAMWLLNGNANDVGGVWNGTWVGNESYSSTVAKEQQSAFFDGGSYIDIGFIASNYSVFTVSLWMYWDGTSTKMIVAFNDNYDLYLYSSYIGFNTFNADVYGTNAPPANQWVHIVAEFNVNNVTLNKLWINSVQQTLSQIIGTPNNANAHFNASFRIGGTATYRFTGYIDYVRVFNRALTQAEVDTLFTEI